MLRLILTAALLLPSSLVHASEPSAKASTAKTVRPKSMPAAKKSKKTSQRKTKPSPFDPSAFLQEKEKHAQAPNPDENSKAAQAKQLPPSIKRQGVVCQPVRKQDENCTGQDCAADNKNPVVIAEQPEPSSATEAAPDSMDTARITQNLMNTIKENCAPEQGKGPFVKPVFEIGIKENTDPSAGTAREVVPKVGVQASF